MIASLPVDRATSSALIPVVVGLVALRILLPCLRSWWAGSGVRKAVAYMAQEAAMREYAIFLQERLNQESDGDIGVPYGPMSPDEMDDAITTLCDGVEGPEVTVDREPTHQLDPSGTGRLHLLAYGPHGEEGRRHGRLILLLYRGDRWTAYTRLGHDWASVVDARCMTSGQLLDFSAGIQQTHEALVAGQVESAINARELHFGLGTSRLLAERPLVPRYGTRYIDNATAEDVVAVLREHEDLRKRVFAEFGMQEA